MSVLVLAEHEDGKLKDATAKTVNAARLLGEDIHILVAGENCRSVAEQAAKISGVAKILLSEQPALKHQLAEAMASLLMQLAPSYIALLAPATTAGKNIMPRVAALLDVMQISDITMVLSPDTFERLIYAGNAIQTVKSTDDKKVITVRTASFKAAEEGNNAPIEAISIPVENALSSFVRQDVFASERPELSSARIIISGGRALGSAEKFKELIEPLADALGAAVGASRAAVDAGYAPNDCQVGQTGKVVAPDLYIAIGISGAIQHLAGMKDSKVIVAINKDGDAPIFQIADYGLVGDLFTLVPELKTELEKARAP
jgi:electron transfer flavoprotein alpha subunit